ncbi:hypothetical protein pqer_cds_1123 [Pandoravirus quercus]|uniref:Uncharacterized protein n=2 Tax=Pandoravirus TaxID=2060084 RepID=A0A2U7UAY7_9VIRU|nr:hypothetical protein pqer_cds_1123 [Pandoravirus quercus]AVK75545.1 hypothetical protein pqer_cds_1123 [Pandoravirus quercus]QBZ81720.1 hypothetical protein pclt_cds_1138 [Pandoravirus celtis]
MSSTKAACTSRKRTVAHTVDEFRTILRDLSAKPSKRPRHARHQRVPAYAAPCDDTDVFDMLPNEMVREVLMRVECWRDVAAFQATARRFASVLAPCDTWTRKYAPTTPYDLTVSVRARDTGEPNLVADDRVGPCDDEPLEAFVAVHARWGMAAKGFDVAGLCRLAAAGRTDALLWLDARVYQMYSDVGIAPTSDDYLGASFVEPAMLRCRGRYARAAAAAGQSDTLAAVLAAHVSLAAHGEKIMHSALESDCAATVDVVHAFARSHDGQWRAHKWCHNGFGPVPPSSPLASSTAPLSVLTHLATRGCPIVPKPTAFAMAMIVSKGLLRVAVWLDTLPEVQEHPHELRRCSRRDVDRAAADGHYAVVQWTHERGIRRCALSTLLSGIRSGHPQGRVDFVRWALAEDPLWHHGIDTMEERSDGAGDIATVPAAGPWTGPPSTGPRRPRPARVPEWRDGLLAIEAAKAGALDVVQWLYENHPEMVSIEAARAAASACNADIAIYLHEVGVAPLTAYPCLRRASERIPDTERRSRQSVDRVADALDKLAAAGAPYDPRVLANVVRHQCAPALRVIVKHYCVDPTNATDTVARHGPLSLPSSSSTSPTSSLPPPAVHGEPASARLPTPADIMRAAVAADRLDMIRWVRDNVKGARLCVAVEAMRAAGRKPNRIAALGRCRCVECKAPGAATAKKKSL